VAYRETHANLIHRHPLLTASSRLLQHGLRDRRAEPQLTVASTGNLVRNWGRRGHSGPRHSPERMAKKTLRRLKTIIFVTSSRVTCTVLTPRRSKKPDKRSSFASPQKNVVGHRVSSVVVFDGGRRGGVSGMGGDEDWGRGISWRMSKVRVAALDHGPSEETRRMIE